MKTPRYYDANAYNAARSIPSCSAGNSDLPAGSPTPFKGTIVDPKSPTSPVNVTYTSYPRQALVQLANRGDLDALRELIRNPGGIDVQQAVANARYLIDMGATGPYGGPGSSR